MTEWGVIFSKFPLKVMRVFSEAFDVTFNAAADGQVTLRAQSKGGVAKNMVCGSVVAVLTVQLSSEPSSSTGESVEIAGLAVDFMNTDSQSGHRAKHRRFSNASAPASPFAPPPGSDIPPFPVPSLTSFREIAPGVFARRC